METCDRRLSDLRSFVYALDDVPKNWELDFFSL